MKICGTQIKFYLMEKYDWSASIFSQIDWKAHHKELQKFPRKQKVTLHKYIHGWLATQKRKFRERRSVDDTCPLCGGVESGIIFLYAHTNSFTRYGQHTGNGYVPALLKVQYRNLGQYSNQAWMYLQEQNNRQIRFKTSGQRTCG